MFGVSHMDSVSQGGSLEDILGISGQILDAAGPGSAAGPADPPMVKAQHLSLASAGEHLRQAPPVGGPATETVNHKQGQTTC